MFALFFILLVSRDSDALVIIVTLVVIAPKLLAALRCVPLNVSLVFVCAAYIPKCDVGRWLQLTPE